MITIYRELPTDWKSVNLKVYKKLGMGPYYVNWNALKQPEVRPLKVNDTETFNFWAFQWHINEVPRYYGTKIKSIIRWSQTVNLMWMYKSSIATWVLAQLFWKLFLKSL